MIRRVPILLLAAAAGCVVVLALLAVDARTRARTGHGSQEELAGVESGDDADEATDSTR